MKKYPKEEGFTLLEVITTLAISGFVILGIINGYRIIVATSYDNKLRTTTRIQADSVLQTIGSELKTLGNGVPFDQANFQIGESSLDDSTVTEPILVNSASSSSISFRLNETGEIYILTSSFDPSSSLTIALFDVSNLEVGNTIYLNNGVLAGDDGLYGTITNVNTLAKTVTIDSDYIASPGAVFDSGSTCEQVSIVTYESFASWSGVTRNSDSQTTIIAPNLSLIHI